MKCHPEVEGASSLIQMSLGLTGVSSAATSSTSFIEENHVSGPGNYPSSSSPATSNSQGQGSIIGSDNANSLGLLSPPYSTTQNSSVSNGSNNLVGTINGEVLVDSSACTSDIVKN